ncbi:MAG: DUF1211 domain-containing protein [Rhodocyclaceae bacterium]|nr:DUF1211 domain-containing protein [Rhodocyclaceae bacterium]
MNTPFHMGRARIETLVDGIFAIAMTILVLEVKVPELADKRSVDELIQALGHHGYVIGAYFFSFLMLAVFWTWHHRMAEKVRVFDKALLMCTVVFLSLICFFPFAAALFGRYPTNGVALFVYVMVTGFIIASQTLYFKTAMMRGLLLESLSRTHAIQGHARNLRGCAIFMVASVPASLRLNEWVAIGALALGVIIFWHSKRIMAVAAVQANEAP